MMEVRPTTLIDHINSPADLRALKPEQLPQVCRELRRYILEVLSVTPGHLGSSLGAVDFTVALHYVFDTPYDRIVWDVGHQAYSHKILTGRREDFRHLRQWGGISGFPSPKESEYDTFPAGHASNSISAALGMAVASAAKDEKRKVIAVIGDGSMTGGMAFEGLNNASSFPNNLLIILNDNNMSIDRNVGGLNRYMVDILTSKTYNTIRYDLYKGLRKINLISETNRKNLLRFNNSFKALLARESNLFEGFSIRYFGPVDGNNVLRLVEVLNQIKDMAGPKILHLRTVKGKGYSPAEKQATIWHAPGEFDIKSGERKKGENKPEPPKFQDVFGHTLVELAERDERVVGVTPAMPTGCSMTFLMKKYPNRAYDVGIAEGHAVTFSAGLAKEGLIPFCNIYSSFIQRGYDQVIHDVALSGSHVVICLDRAGLVGEDGATHHGVFDMAFLRCVPDIVVASPLNEHELRNLMLTAYKGYDGPMVIRYPRGKGVLTDWRNTPRLVEIGRGRCLTEGEAIAFLSIGPIGNMVQKVVERLAEKGVSAAHYDMVFLKPLDEEMLHGIAKKFDTIISVEDGCIQGGFGSAVMEFMADHDYHPRIRRVGVPDRFIGQGSVPEQYADCGMDADSLLHLTEELLLHP
ncbi:1-deoxy-D-xylulose-5-phosphate synthase [Porphyromonas gingivalis]|uniref:1-deoxy-D-xylulose-5-phosphate synthase n=1 Tax=Porphyromonas gingivalis TaxID=837 RepID=UPI00097CFFB5|nr:1-deoxy-D-xylulose-5-phosphate synthase [Porphyromonas gingivalis]ATS09545.1 1-deoxy-D-xylulose-5-phosphate synthase [Porphyromonas gingivalis]